MNAVEEGKDRLSQATIEQLVEPVVGAICAADNPDGALAYVQIAISDGVRQVKLLAREHVAKFPKNFLR